jgi:hypothetical protein
MKDRQITVQHQQKIYRDRGLSVQIQPRGFNLKSPGYVLVIYLPRNAFFIRKLVLETIYWPTKI